MTITGQINTVDYDDEEVRGIHHKPVVRSGKFAAAQGVLPMGLILESDGAGGYEEAALVADAVAVLAERLDTDQSTAGAIIVHGSVQQQALKVGAVAPVDPDGTWLAKLETLGIWPE